MGKMLKNLKHCPVLITGANGFIGSHLTKKLTLLGAKVNTFIEPGTSLIRIEEVKSLIKNHSVDVRNYEKVRALVKKIKPIKIYHLAGSSDVTRSFDLIDKMIDINLKGAMNILRALKETGVQFDSFVNTGTCEEYGDNEAPFRETQRPNPVSPYSASKLSVTYFCQMLYKTQKMPITTLRPFLTYGPGQVGNMLVPSLIKKCFLNENFKMTKGEQTRDFNYVLDIVEGYIQASITEAAVGEIINLSSGREYKIKDVVNMIICLMGSNIKPQMGALPYRAGEAMHFYGSNEKAKKILKWKPMVSLEEGLKETIKWYKGHPEMYTGLG
jgi:nucleoside-diphosphate-sugar epimerase